MQCWEFLCPLYSYTTYITAKYEYTTQNNSFVKAIGLWESVDNRPMLYAYFAIILKHLCIQLPLP